jgi:hypothetical protein
VAFCSSVSSHGLPSALSIDRNRHQTHLSTSLASAMNTLPIWSALVAAAPPLNWSSSFIASEGMLADQSKTQKVGVDKKRVAAAAEEPFLTTGKVWPEFSFHPRSGAI